MTFRSLIIFLFFTILLGSAGCYRNITCPAYHSQFLIDNKAAHDKFSLFGPDTLPKERVHVKKNKHGIIVEKSYTKKSRDMETIPMVTILPEKTDSIGMVRTDSLSSDSLYAIYASKYMTVVNNEQLIYNSLYGQLFFDMQKNKEQALKKETEFTPSVSDTVQSPKAKFKLFKKKEKETPAEEEPTEQKPEPDPSNNEQEDDGF